MFPDPADRRNIAPEFIDAVNVAGRRIELPNNNNPDFTDVARTLYSNDKIDVAVVGTSKWQTIDNPHVGGINTDSLDATLRRYFGLNVGS